MSLVSKVNMNVEKLDRDCDGIRRVAAQVVRVNKRFIDQVNRAVVKHGKSVISAKMGTADTAELVSLFNTAKAILVASGGLEQKDIPDNVN